MLETESQEIEKELPETEESQAEDPAKDNLLDLDSVEKFRFGGQEWTLKDLQGAILRQSDYTRKTQELAESRKTFEQEQRFYDNLDADIESVRKNPQLIKQFKEIYPEKFHRFLKVAGVDEQAALPKGVDPEFYERFSSLEKKLTAQEEKARQEQLTAIEKSIDVTFEKMSTKYPLADHEVVNTRALAYLEKHPDKETLTDKEWEQLFKGVHDQIEKLAKTKSSEMIQGQRRANQASRDIGKGGGIPGARPKEPKSIREATNQWLSQLGGQE
jgi:hypothetical protein